MTLTVTALADHAAAAVHELARLTRPAITTLQVSDLATLTAALSELAAGLPQTLHQLSGYLPADDEDTAVDHAAACLRHASAAAAHLAAALEAAHAESSATSPKSPKPNPRGSTFNRRKGVKFRPALNLRVCHERRREPDRVGKVPGCGAVREMKVWPFGAALRGRLQTTACCVG